MNTVSSRKQAPFPFWPSSSCTGMFASIISRMRECVRTYVTLPFYWLRVQKGIFCIWWWLLEKPVLKSFCYDGTSRHLWAGQDAFAFLWRRTCTHTNKKSFPHHRLSSVTVYLTDHLAAALLKKKTANSGYFLRYMTNNSVVLPHGDCKWDPRGGLTFEGKCIFENKPPSQSTSCLLLRKGGGNYFREDTVLTLATINFNLAGVQLLISGGSYSRATFTLFGAVPLGDIDTCMIDLIFRIDFQDIWLRMSSRTKPNTPYFCLNRMIVCDLWSWPHPLNFIHACLWLLFEGSYYFFHRTRCVATIPLVGVRLLYGTYIYLVCKSKVQYYKVPCGIPNMNFSKNALFASFGII